MADFTGTVDAPTKLLAGDVSANINLITADFTPGAARASGDACAALAFNLGAVVPMDNTGAHARQFGECLFEKIIITPRSVNLGFLLSATTFPVDVWNTHTRVLRTLTAVNVTGNGFTVTNPTPLPALVAPLSSLPFTATVSVSGDPTIDASAAWVFSEDAAPGTLIVTGTRITLFALDPDWEKGISERTEYLTQVLTAYDATEQRYALRKHPRTRLAYDLTTTARRDTAKLDAILFATQGRMYGVPFWPDAQPLLADVNPGAISASLDTTLRKFAAGGWVMLWRDMHTAEALGVVSKTDGGVVFSSPVQGTYPAGVSFAAPVLTGRLADQLDVPRLSGESAQAKVEFECEVI